MTFENQKSVVEISKGRGHITVVYMTFAMLYALHIQYAEICSGLGCKFLQSLYCVFSIVLRKVFLSFGLVV